MFSNCTGRAECFEKTFVLFVCLLEESCDEDSELRASMPSSRFELMVCVLLLNPERFLLLEGAGAATQGSSSS